MVGKKIKGVKCASQRQATPNSDPKSVKTTSAAIAACRAEKPDVYVRVIAGLLPKDMTIKVQSLDELTDDQLLRKLAVLTEMAKPLLARLPTIDGLIEVKAQLLQFSEYARR